MKNKTCIKCNIQKDILEFRKSKQNTDGSINKCKSCEKEYMKEYNERTKNIRIEKKKEYYKKNFLEISEKNKEYKNKNLTKFLKYQKEYKRINKEKLKEKNKIYEKNKKIIDPLFKLKKTVRTRIYQAFTYKNWKKNKGSQELLGESFEFVKHYIEIQFKKGMTWENYGQWHIDHKIPLASAKTEEEIISLCHYTNIQPLWAQDNISKKDKIIEQQLKLI